MKGNYTFSFGEGAVSEIRREGSFPFLFLNKGEDEQMRIWRMVRAGGSNRVF